MMKLIVEHLPSGAVLVSLGEQRWSFGPDEVLNVWIHPKDVTDDGIKLRPQLMSAVAKSGA